MLCVDFSRIQYYWFRSLSKDSATLVDVNYSFLSDFKHNRKSGCKHGCSGALHPKRRRHDRPLALRVAPPTSYAPPRAQEAAAAQLAAAAREEGGEGAREGRNAKPAQAVRVSPTPYCTQKTHTQPQTLFSVYTYPPRILPVQPLCCAVRPWQVRFPVRIFRRADVINQLAWQLDASCSHSELAPLRIDSLCLARFLDCSDGSTVKRKRCSVFVQNTCTRVSLETWRLFP